MQEQKNTSDYYTVAFYNLENLFDTFDNKQTHDDDYTPTSERQWTPKRYNKKVRKLGYVISEIGVKTSKRLPAIVGLAEVENNRVIDDLLDSKFLKKHSYDYVHYDSPDERGIDVAMLYHKDYFELNWSEVYPLELYDDDGSRDYSRDILLVNGKLNGEEIHIIINHWPSRREGVTKTQPSRLIASNKVLEIIKSIKTEKPSAKCLVMGDFNDGPENESVKQLTTKEELYNPMEELKSFQRGSLSHRFKWNLFDQILFTTNCFEYSPKKHSFSKANIFDKEFLKQFKGKFKGNPFRTYVGKKYKGGYSDHFPVYIHLKQTK